MSAGVTEGGRFGGFCPALPIVVLPGWRVREAHAITFPRDGKLFFEQINPWASPSASNSAARALAQDGLRSDSPAITFRTISMKATAWARDVPVSEAITAFDTLSNRATASPCVR